MTTVATTNPEESVRSRYSAAAHEAEASLCCPVDYDPEYLEVIPKEILERDYGCGDPSPFVREGDAVVDLGAGGGKLCYIAAQIVGPTGKVIGVDCNREMLALAKKYQATVAERLGYANVDFRNGLIQDLQLNLDLLAKKLAEHPIHDAQSWLRLRSIEEQLRSQDPLIPSNSVDCVVSNCVLNLVRRQDRPQLFSEIFRVLKRGGRAAISDIVCDEEVTDEMQRDPELWSGCISGAYREEEFLRAFEDAGFHGIHIARLEQKPWRTVNGIEFRSMTIVAYKGKQGPCLERNQALIYKGPFRRVEDDDGHVFPRGQRIAVCDKTFHLLQREPYQGQFEPVEPLNEIPLEQAADFDCKRTVRRDPRETKGQNYRTTTLISSNGGCGTDGPCC